MITQILTLAATASETAEKVSETAGMSIGEIAIYGGKKSLFGTVVVFAVLILLWGILSLFRYIFEALEKGKTTKPTIKPVDVKTVEEPSYTPVQITENITDNKKLVAVITAAISAYREKSGESTGFRVVSFKKRKI